MQTVPENGRPNPNPLAAQPADPGTPEFIPAQPPVQRGNSIGLWLRDLLVSAVASVLIITFLYQPVRVEGTSMLPRLEDRDRLFINKFVYHISAIERGDVVVFHYPRDPEKSYPGIGCASIMAWSCSMADGRLRTTFLRSIAIRAQLRRSSFLRVPIT